MPVHSGPAGRPDSPWSRTHLARLLSLIEAGDEKALLSLPALPPDGDHWVVGITGAPGAGKSTLISCLLSHLREQGERVAVLAVDPSSHKTGGALLGDRIRMTRHTTDPHVFIRSLASRGDCRGLSLAVPGAVRAVVTAGYEWVLLETVGVGQSAVSVGDVADVVLLLAPPGLGDAVQASKAGVNEIADIFVVAKADQPGAKVAAHELQTSTRLDGRAAGEWRPPVLLAAADDETSTLEVLGALARHRRHSIDSGAALLRRRAQRVSQWKTIAEALLAKQLAAALASADADALGEAVEHGRIEPREAAWRLVELAGLPLDEKSDGMR